VTVSKVPSMPMVLRSYPGNEKQKPHTDRKNSRGQPEVEVCQNGSGERTGWRLPHGFTRPFSHFSNRKEEPTQPQGSPQNLLGGLVGGRRNAHTHSHN
jgi:hypothetical protein